MKQIEVQVTHLLQCYNSRRCSALSQSLSHDASLQQIGHRCRLLSAASEQRPSRSMVVYSGPDQKPHGRRSSPGDSDRTTWTGVDGIVSMRFKPSVSNPRGPMSCKV